jgi:hypothetical protein
MAGEKKSPAVPPGKLTYNVYIVDKQPQKPQSWEDKDDYTKNGVITKLTGWMGQIATVAAYKGTPPAQVNWVGSYPQQIKDHEMICYFIPKATSAFGADKSKAHGQGMTGWRNGSSMLTEIWLETMRPFGLDNFIDMLAKMIFHEWMHQKLDSHPSDDTNDIHNRATGLGVTPVELVRGFTDEDRDDMAAAIDKKYKQYRN